MKFLTHGPGYALFLTANDAVLSLHQAAKPAGLKNSRNWIATKASEPVEKRGGNTNRKSTVLRITLVGANPKASIEGVEPNGGRANYFIGNQPGKWQRDLPTYGRVAYRGVYPRIDQVYYGGSQDRLEYDFVVAPGGNPKEIRMRFESGDKLRLDDKG